MRKIKIIVAATLTTSLLTGFTLNAQHIGNTRTDNLVSNNEVKEIRMDGFSGTNQKLENQCKWTIETSLVFPLAAQIYMLKASYRFCERSEFGFGPAFQNWINIDKSPRGQAHAYTLLLSYRYYFWRNFNAELELWPAYNHFKSHVYAKTYKGFELWVEYKVGYKFDLTKNLNVNLQPGIGHALWLQHKWPGIEGRSTLDLIEGSLIFVPQVLLGWTF